MRFHNLRSALAVAASAGAALVAAEVAYAAPSGMQLLRQYQPVTVFDPAERFRPTNVRSFVLDADLERFENGVWVVVDPDPKPSELPSAPGFRLDQDSCTPASTLGGLACYAAAADAAGGDATVYGRVVRTPDAIVLQYWYFYYDDVYSYLSPPADCIWQAHEGDWEAVNVVLGPDRTPVEVGYSQHCLGQRRSWGATPRVDGTHPVVHVALGSHANFFAPGLHPIDSRCVPPAAIALLLQNGLPLPVDRADAGPVAGPAAPGREPTDLKPLGDETAPWLAFRGAWGESQYFHSPLTGTVAFGTAPVGPAFHAVWRDPLGTLAAWPRG